MVSMIHVLTPRPDYKTWIQASHKSWKSRHAFRAYSGRGNMPLQAIKLPISHNNVVGENTVLQLNILETGVLILVVQNSSPTRLRLVGDEFWTTRVRTPVSKMFRWRTYNSHTFLQTRPVVVYIFYMSKWHQLNLKNEKSDQYVYISKDN